MPTPTADSETAKAKDPLPGSTGPQAGRGCIGRPGRQPAAWWYEAAQNFRGESQVWKQV